VHTSSPGLPRGPRVLLREFGPGDAAAWLRLAGDPLVTRYSSWAPITSPEASVAWLREAAWAATQNPRRGFSLAVQELASSDLIGGAALDVTSHMHRQGEIGFSLRPDRWGNKLGTEIGQLLLELGFDRLGLRRLEAVADPENLASQRVLQHLRMRQEGRLRDKYFIAGQWRERLLYAITRPEWTATA
jgi:RimJ/RimL family protein N-acetyltransferase